MGKNDFQDGDFDNSFFLNWASFDVEKLCVEDVWINRLTMVDSTLTMFARSQIPSLEKTMFTLHPYV
jgi:hypothetical protein